MQAEPLSQQCFQELLSFLVLVCPSSLNSGEKELYFVHDGPAAASGQRSQAGGRTKGGASFSRPAEGWMAVSTGGTPPASQVCPHVGMLPVCEQQQSREICLPIPQLTQTSQN